MAKQKKEFNNQSVQELQTTLKDLDRDLFALRSELSMNRKLEKPHLLKAKRKDKARVLTFLTQKQQSEKIVKGV